MLIIQSETIDSCKYSLSQQCAPVNCPCQLFFAPSAWIGLNDRAKEGTYVFEGTKGAAISETTIKELTSTDFFDTNEPGGKEKENCILYDAGFERFHDYPCNTYLHKFPYICRLFPPDPPTTSNTPIYCFESIFQIVPSSENESHPHLLFMP